MHKRHYCGGSIITSEHILTAAHCCFGGDGIPINPEFYTVVVGDTNIYTNSTNTEERDVVSIKYHEDYNPVGFINDVAVMKVVLVKTLISAFHGESNLYTLAL